MVDRCALERAFAGYARTVLGRYDVGELLYRLTDQVVEVLGADGAGVSLSNDGGELRFVTATDDRIVRIEETQIQAAEGPCHDAFRTAQQVTSRDLRDEQRWPTYRQVTQDQGCRAVAGIPMPARRTTIGALNIYRREPHPWSDRELEVAQLLADMAAGYVLHDRDLEEARTLSEQLQHALDSRVVIEQAKGVIAARHDVDVATAFDRLRRHARSQRRPLHDVCREVVDGDLTL